MAGTVHPLETETGYNRSMSINQALLSELEHEFATTRRVLERVPTDKFDWAPHTKSMKAGRLASHIAEMNTWIEATVHHDSLDLAPVDGPKWEAFHAKTSEELLEFFDKHVAKAKTALAGCDDAAMMGTWSLMMGGKVMMSMPRVACLRTFCMNHVYHHRGQLSVYLRLLDISVPSIYGPSADEGAM